MQGKKANISKEVLSKLLKEHTMLEVANILDVSKTTIYRYKKKYNIEIDQEIIQQRNSERHTKYPCNINYFDKIDTLNKAYLLGFLCADGYVTDRNEIGITVSIKDKGIVEFFKQELKSSKPIKTLNREHPAVELRIQNRYLASVLKKYGIVPRKTLIINIEDVINKSNLNEKQISIFLLGYFDGDGCISISHNKKTNKEYFEMNVTGTKETILFYKKYFNNHGCITKRHNDDKNNYTLQMSNNYTTIYNALSKIYKHSDELTFCLERKKEKFKKLENKVLLFSDK